MASSALDCVNNLLDRLSGDIDSKLPESVESDKQNGNRDSTASAKMSKHFHMSLNNLVFDAIDGELYTNPNVKRLYIPDDPSIKVVYRSDWHKSNAKTNNKIAVISGGGSGHEPCFFGYVGFGMLTAAVCGEIFASPTTKSILYTILKVSIHNNKKGVLLLVGNYTGDVLNFSLAAKIASTTYNIPCKIVFLSDDIAIPQSNISNTGARGIAGQVLIHKIGGYYAEMGCDLNKVYNICNDLNDNYVGSVGIAGSICHHFDHKYSILDEMESDVLELGYGVHGEPGFKQIKNDNIYNIIDQIMALFNDFLGLNNASAKEEKRIVVLLNNLGSVTNMEMLIIKKYLFEYFNNKYNNNIRIERIFSGKFETSLDMKGFSLTIMKDINDEFLKCLDFEVPTIKAWSKGETFQINAFNASHSKSVDEDTQEVLNLIKLSNKDDSKQETETTKEIATKNMCQLSESQANLLKLCIVSVCNTMIANKNDLNKLDNMVGDGDCGTTLEFGCKLLLTAINSNEVNFNSLVLCFEQLSQLLSDMGGSSGALYGYLLICASNQCSKINNNNVFDSISLCKAFKAAIFDLSDYCRAKLNDRTMLDALIPAINGIITFYQSNKNGQNDHKNAITKCAEAAHAGCKQTQFMKAKFGRSSYISSDLQHKCVDPGAKAVALWISSLVEPISNYSG